ncbi:hypothetical protein QTP81_16985 [Alteromonas sp. ASW11-36]|uniref:DUF1801 domain-containing protein n=1 Tax=Alteromonas arenosi TaxID=3055817 RepID=A0ABT7T1N4_9ALTE|nr:hypothetical protein [Alteromonas sp. ASW11-36]MDM7862305.1 hypothetical protein [Alteromonas sp. ASW11-36]
MTDPQAIFQELKAILAEYADEMIVLADEDDHFYLNTHHIMKNKKPMYFGSVKINKRYVSFHLMPVYVFPELLTSISARLKKRMQGKSCFNFTVSDEPLFTELTALVKNAYEMYAHEGYL